MRGLVEHFKEEGKDLKSPAVQQELQNNFMKSAQDAGEAALQAQGVTLTQFENSVRENSSDANVGRSLAMLQMKQQQELAALSVES
jgi:hypothetical protein